MMKRFVRSRPGSGPGSINEAKEDRRNRSDAGRFFLWVLFISPPLVIVGWLLFGKIIAQLPHRAAGSSVVGAPSGDQAN